MKFANFIFSFSVIRMNLCGVGKNVHTISFTMINWISNVIWTKNWNGLKCKWKLIKSGKFLWKFSILSHDQIKKRKKHWTKKNNKGKSFSFRRNKKHKNCFQERKVRIKVGADQFFENSNLLISEVRSAHIVSHFVRSFISYITHSVSVKIKNPNLWFINVFSPSSSSSLSSGSLWFTVIWMNCECIRCTDIEVGKSLYTNHKIPNFATCIIPLCVPSIKHANNKRNETERNKRWKYRADDWKGATKQKCLILG